MRILSECPYKWFGKCKCIIYECPILGCCGNGHYKNSEKIKCTHCNWNFKITPYEICICCNFRTLCMYNVLGYRHHNGFYINSILICCIYCKIIYNIHDLNIQNKPSYKTITSVFSPVCVAG